MRLAVFGSSITSAHANGATTFFRGICKALHDLGWEIWFLEESRGKRKNQARSRSWAKGITVHFYQTDESLTPLFTFLSTTDVIIKFSECGTRDREIEEGLLVWHSPHQLVLLADGDAPAILPPILHNPDHYWWNIISKFDGILLINGGKKAGQHYQLLGARQIYYLSSGVDPHRFKPHAPDPSLICDLLFVGNCLGDRETRVKEFFFATAEQSPASTFLLAGSGWDDYPLPPNISTLGFVPPTRLPVLYSSARLVLSLTRSSMVQYGYSPPSRLFEAAACGACILSDFWEGMELFFQPGTEIQIVWNTDDVSSALCSLTPEKRNSVGAAARQRVLHQHTFIHRARILTAILASQLRHKGLRLSSCPPA